MNPAVAGRIFAAALAGLAGLALWKGPELWRRLQKRWQGARFAILGAESVGKTRLWNLLTSGSVADKEFMTGGPTPVRGRRLELREFKWKVADAIDIPGNKMYWPQWEELVRGSEAVHPGHTGPAAHEPAQVIIYMLRADQIAVGDKAVMDRISRDGEHIQKWLGMCNPRPRFFIIGTFADRDASWISHRADPQGHEKYRLEFRKRSAVWELMLRAGGERLVDVLVGSLKTQEDAEDLLCQLLIQLDKELKHG